MSTVDETLFGSRLRLVLGRFGSVAALARVIGVSDNAIYKWIAGRGQPSLASLVAMARAAGVSVEWLATGRESTRRVRGANPSSDYVIPPRGELRIAGARAGVIRNPQIVDSLAFRAEWLDRLASGISSGAVMLLEAAGDAMAPTINGGDLLIVDLNQTRPRADGLYVLRDGSDLTVRRLDCLRAGGAVGIRCDNPAYGEAVVPITKLKIVGRVLWSGGRR